jgi:hypothetical protein
MILIILEFLKIQGSYHCDFFVLTFPRKPDDCNFYNSTSWKRVRVLESEPDFHKEGKIK